MAGKIKTLDSVTIDRIAAGEVVERPVGAVKELLENAIDAGASSITVEIEEGGTGLIRLTDNGEGIAPEDVRQAFGRHATSKISRIEDLDTLHTLGFRGEALSSIAAVARCELITKTRDTLTGIRYVIEGGEELSYEEIGAPEGTTIIVRDLFYNTPARKKFLKKPQTEGSYIAELMEHQALAHPQVSLRFINNHTDRFHTSGSGDLKENIYRIYGRDIAASIFPIEADGPCGLHMTGYLGKPAINRSNRSFELFFVNGRPVTDKMLSASLEEGYRPYLMQHKFPFAVLAFSLPSSEVDVNVHPTKREVRFANARQISSFLTSAVAGALHDTEMIPDALLDEERERREGLPFAAANDGQRSAQTASSAAEPFERSYLVQETGEEHQPLFAYGLAEEPVAMSDRYSFDAGPKDGAQRIRPVQERLFSEEAVKEYRILGQIFDTYWLMVCGDELLMMDQHAAHEKVNYERMMKRFREKTVMSQMVDPPEVIRLTPPQEELFSRYAPVFDGLGFQTEPFGERTVALRGIPLDLYGADAKTMFLEILDALNEEGTLPDDPVAVSSRIAGMACKASVKGNMHMTVEELRALLDEMMTLENPYNCPHGRPTLIRLSRFEIEKRFKRVVD